MCERVLRTDALKNEGKKSRKKVEIINKRKKPSTLCYVLMLYVFIIYVSHKQKYIHNKHIEVFSPIILPNMICTSTTYERFPLL